MKKIDKIQKEIDKMKKQNDSSVKNNLSSPVIDVAAQLVSSVFVGVVVGLMLDNLFDSKPLFLIICIILSVIAAFRSIWRKYK